MWAVQCAAGRPVGPFSSLSGKYCALHHIAADDAATADAHSFFSAPAAWVGAAVRSSCVRCCYFENKKGILSLICGVCFTSKFRLNFD